MEKNVGADPLEIEINIGVCVPQNGEAQLPEVGISDGIRIFAGKVKMLGAVQLDDQLFAAM